MKKYSEAYHWLLSSVFYTLVVFVAYQIVFNPAQVGEWWGEVCRAYNQTTLTL